MSHLLPRERIRFAGRLFVRPFVRPSVRPSVDYRFVRLFIKIVLSRPDDWEDGDAAAPEKAPDAASMSLLNKKVQTELYELKNDTVEVQRKDPNSPLYSVRSFEEMHLKPEILKGERESVLRRRRRTDDVEW